ncbi:MAG: radical SAM family heme chaperone HemW [Acidobacteriota bacterium]|nr:radical SAM family heme chaperone HemW [Acidobacteriota bacterium]
MSNEVHSALYLSVPFCKSKCSFCNFASGVFSRQLFDRYVAHLEQAIASSPQVAEECGTAFDPILDSVYLGGGTPSVLAPDQLRRVMQAIRATFTLAAGVEFTVEIAPGTLSEEILAVLVEASVNRVSLGVQSFVDQETRAVGRLHNRETTLADVERLRAAGIAEISIDLIAGLPYQTEESWRRSLDDLIALRPPHASVYMLEVDDDSRLGRELIAGGERYHAHHVPDEALTVALYEQAADSLNAAGIAQYEISNFAHAGHESRHNLRYWQRQPYFGFGVEASAMLPAPLPGEPHRALRISQVDSLDALLGGAKPERTVVGEQQAIEETYFLGLRQTKGVELVAIKQEFGIDAVDRYREVIAAQVERGLLEIEDGWLRLTRRGRLLSNDVFAEFLTE